jgi:GT2 family glycosyltransferase
VSTGPAEVTVVIPNWNGRHFLEPCLEALRAQRYESFDTLVVDNASTDDSQQLLRTRFPEVRLLELGENRGFAGAMNAGIAAAETPLVAFLNNDTEADPAWLAELVACLERHPDAAGAASKLVIRSSGLIDGAGDCFGKDLFPHPRGHGFPDEGLDEEVEVFGASGGASLWRAEALTQVGAFDEAFFAYFEDADLCFRARHAGWTFWYAPGSVVLHHRGGTSGGFSDFGFVHPIRNRWFLTIKNVPLRVVLRHLHLVAWSELVLWARAAYRRKLGAMARAYRDVLASRGRLLQQRREILSSSRLRPTELERLLHGRGLKAGARTARA